MTHPERIVPDETEPGIVALHLKRYEFARPFCVGKDVLDAGCGVGYGTAYLAETARRVVGVDVDADAIEYARVISSPSSLVCLSDSHCPGTKPNRGTFSISNSRCLVIPESETELIRRAVKVWNGDITALDEYKQGIEASRPTPNDRFLLHCN